MAFVEDIGAHAAAEGGSVGAGWGAATVREYSWQAIAFGRVRGIAAALHESAQRWVREDRRRRSPGVLSMSSALVAHVLGRAIPYSPIPWGGGRGIGEYIPLEAMPPLLPFPNRNAPSIEKRLFCFQVSG